MQKELKKNEVLDLNLTQLDERDRLDALARVLAGWISEMYTWSPTAQPPLNAMANM